MICFFVLLAIGFRFVHRHLLVSTGFFVVAVLFLVNVFYIASGRTALVVIAVLLFVFAFWQWEWKKAVVVLLTAVVCAFVVWKTSTYLRTELALMPGEIQRYLSENAITRSGERLEYWQKSVSFISDAPILGHGTGSIRELFRQAAIGQSGASALVSDNPHNQTLTIAIQLGFAGVALLYAMWIGHLRLFLGTNLPAGGRVGHCRAEYSVQFVQLSLVRLYAGLDLCLRCRRCWWHCTQMPMQRESIPTRT